MNFCKDCKHAIAPDLGERPRLQQWPPPLVTAHSSVYRCGHEGARSVVDGTPQECRGMRAYDYKCGETGRWFAAKEKV
jgi:hypothetical protein